eukprot:gene22691-biopygen8786
MDLKAGGVPANAGTRIAESRVYGPPRSTHAHRRLGCVGMRLGRNHSLFSQIAVTLSTVAKPAPSSCRSNNSSPAGRKRIDSPFMVFREIPLWCTLSVVVDTSADQQLAETRTSDVALAQNETTAGGNRKGWKSSGCVRKKMLLRAREARPEIFWGFHVGTAGISKKNGRAKRTPGNRRKIVVPGIKGRPTNVSRVIGRSGAAPQAHHLKYKNGKHGAAGAAREKKGFGVGGKSADPCAVGKPLESTRKPGVVCDILPGKSAASKTGVLKSRQKRMDCHELCRVMYTCVSAERISPSPCPLVDHELSEYREDTGAGVVRARHFLAWGGAGVARACPVPPGRNSTARVRSASAFVWVTPPPPCFCGPRMVRTNVCRGWIIPCATRCARQCEQAIALWCSRGGPEEPAQRYESAQGSQDMPAPRPRHARATPAPPKPKSGL